MPSRSPTQAFAPTPALEYNNISFLNGKFRHHSMDPFGDHQSKEVRFEEPLANSSIHGRHSIATSNVPLLPPVPSASHVPKQSFRMTNPTPGVDMNAYFEQCRNVNEQLRQAHEQERKAWEIERTALRTRIADLEFKLNKAQGTKRRLSNESQHAIARSFRSELISPTTTNNGILTNGTKHDHTQRHHSVPTTAASFAAAHINPPVWQPESPLPATRVFSHDDDVSHLPSISEDEPYKQDLEKLSPHTSHENVPIHIKEIDNSLDGIIVKSEGVKSSFNKVMSPIMSGSPAISPAARPPMNAPQIIEPLQIDSSQLLDPLDEKLKRFAGHTPLAFDGPLSETVTTEGNATPREEKPIAPASTKRPPLRPSENSDSYFSTEDIHAGAPPIVNVAENFPLVEEAVLDDTEPDADPDPTLTPPDHDLPLRGPLMLDPSGKSASAHIFLEKLDHQLEEVVRKSQSNSPETSPDATRTRDDARQEAAKSRDEEDMPMLKMRKSTNFGSAYGLTVPGTC